MGKGRVTSDVLQSGTRLLERYEILAELGVGSFGRVYKARQLSTGQDVAVKTIRVHERDTAEDVRRHVDRFRREMRLCAALSHPHIVRLLDSGSLPDETLFVVFEFVPGLTLREVLASEGKLDPREAIRLMSQVLDALGCAHAQGIVHRDLKPENIMLTKTGIRRNAMVLDFGLGGFAEYAVEATRLTATHEMMGTPCYAAPEQLRGERPSPRGDLYSWGLIFLECLTGEIAVGGTTAHEVLARQLNAAAVPIPAWLRRQRLGRVLATVTAKNVDERNVTVVGLVEALGGIDFEAGLTRAAGGAAAPREGERRQVTLVACRAAVARADGGPVDLEDLDQVLQAQVERYERLAALRDTAVASASAERALLVFGYPRAQEHDAHRAVRAALHIVAETRMASDRLARERGLRIAVAIGVHSDLVIVREGAAGYEVVGTAPQVATRISDRAAPGEVLLSADTRKLLRGEIDSDEAVGVESVEPGRTLALYRVTAEPLAPGATSSPIRPELPLVERAEEVAQLLATWQHAERGSPRVTLIAGEPGIGKSRLLRELKRSIPRDAWLECRCVPENRSSPLRPVVDLLSGLPDSLPDLLARYQFDQRGPLPLLASLLALPVPEPGGSAPLSPEVQKERTLGTIVAIVLRMAAERPRALVVEDLQWADPTTIDFLTALVEELRAVHGDAPGRPRLCVLFTARPEFAAPWSPADVTAISLTRLSRAGIEALVRSRVPTGREPPAELFEHVTSRTDGVPLFVEELTYLMLETGALTGEEDASWRKGLDTAIPGTLRELLGARLDALSPSARDTAQLAAALGRESRHEVLAAVAEKDEAVLRQDLRELADARILQPRRTTREFTYVFRHALVRDAAYESMLRPGRQRVHRRIAMTILERFRDVSEQQPELVAQHLESGGETAAAVEYWQRAGDRALQRAAFPEAKQHLGRGLAAAERLPASPARTRAEIELLTSLGTALFSTQGFASPEVETTFARAQILCDRIGGDVPPKILSGIIGVHITRGDRAATDRLLPHLRRLADSPRDVVEQVTGAAGLGIDAFWRGKHEAARNYLDRARAGYRTEAFQRYVREYGYDGGIFSYAYTAWNLWVLGEPAEAEATCRELLALAERSLDPHARSLALSFGVLVADMRRDAAETIARAERLIAIATEQKLHFWLALGLCGHGAGLARAGEAGRGIGEIQQGLNLTRMIGATVSYGYYQTLLADALRTAGLVVEARAAIDEGLELCRESLGRFHEPELLRLGGELLRASGQPADAEAAFGRALTLAREHGARSWALRAATSLASLRHAQGADDEASAIVGAALEAIPGAIDGPDLREAQALLAPPP
jgi:TOMM system kinase/cyclase fusion protein